MNKGRVDFEMDYEDLYLCFLRLFDLLFNFYSNKKNSIF